MKVRALLAAGAAAAALVGTGVGAGVASAAPTGHTASSSRPVLSGIAAPMTGHAAAPAVAPAASCREPNCNMGYHRGPVQHNPHVYLVFWGHKWNRGMEAYKLTTAFFRGIGTSRDQWSRSMTQYHDRHSRPHFTGSVLKGVFVDHVGLTKDLGWGHFEAEALRAYRHFRIRDKGDAQIIIMAQSGTCFVGNMGTFSGNCGSHDSAGFYCGWHSATNAGIPVVNLPYQLDAQQYCGRNFINGGTRGAYDGFTLVGGHEYAETTTDPYPASGWIDMHDIKIKNASGGENADKCAWGGQPWGLHDPAGNLHLSTGSFAVQSLWSNKNHRCVM